MNEAGDILLCRIDDPHDPAPPSWITPGGAVEPGETLQAAAARELHEETGLTVDPAALGEPVAVCRGDWTFRGAAVSSEDWYFGLRASRFEPSSAGLTAIEREVHDSWRWWSPTELDATHEVVYPLTLADVARGIARGDRPSTPLELPWSSA